MGGDSLVVGKTLEEDLMTNVKTQSSNKVQSSNDKIFVHQLNLAFSHLAVGFNPACTRDNS